MVVGVELRVERLAFALSGFRGEVKDSLQDFVGGTEELCIHCQKQAHTQAVP